MTVLAPCDTDEMRRLMPQTTDLQGPCYIRLAKGGDEVVSSDAAEAEIGKAITMRPGGRVLLIGTGVTTTRALHAADLLSARGIDCGLIHLHTVEHTTVGGLGSAVADLLLERMPGRTPAMLRLGIPDRFPDKYGSQDDLLEYYGLQPAQIAERVGVFVADTAKRAA